MPRNKRAISNSPDYRPRTQILPSSPIPILSSKSSTAILSTPQPKSPGPSLLSPYLSSLSAAALLTGAHRENQTLQIAQQQRRSNYETNGANGSSPPQSVSPSGDLIMSSSPHADASNGPIPSPSSKFIFQKRKASPLGGSMNRKKKLDPLFSIYSKDKKVERVLTVDPEMELSLERLKSLEKGLAYQLQQALIQIEIIKEKLQAKDEKLQKLHARSEERDFEYIKYKESVKMKMENVANLEQQLEVKDLNVQGLREEIKQLQRDLEEKDSLRDQLLKEKDIVFAKLLREKDFEISDRDEIIKQRDATIEELRKDTDSIQQNREQFLSEIRQLQSQIQSMEMEKSSLNRELIRAQDKYEEIQGKYMLVDRQFAIILDENRQLDEDKDQLKKMIEQYRKDNEELQQSLEDMLMSNLEEIGNPEKAGDTPASPTATNISSVPSVLKRVHSSRTEALFGGGRADDVSQSTEAESVAVEKVDPKLQKEVERLTTENEDLQEANRELRDEIEEMRREVEDLRRLWESSEKKEEEMTRRLEEAEARANSAANTQRERAATLHERSIAVQWEGIVGQSVPSGGSFQSHVDIVAAGSHPVDSKTQLMGHSAFPLAQQELGQGTEEDSDGAQRRAPVIPPLMIPSPHDTETNHFTHTNQQHAEIKTALNTYSASQKESLLHDVPSFSQATHSNTTTVTTALHAPLPKDSLEHPNTNTTSENITATSSSAPIHASSSPVVNDNEFLFDSHPVNITESTTHRDHVSGTHNNVIQQGISVAGGSPSAEQLFSAIGDETQNLLEHLHDGSNTNIEAQTLEPTLSESEPFTSHLSSDKARSVQNHLPQNDLRPSSPLVIHSGKLTDPVSEPDTPMSEISDERSVHPHGNEKDEEPVTVEDIDSYDRDESSAQLGDNQVPRRLPSPDLFVSTVLTTTSEEKTTPKAWATPHTPHNEDDADGNMGEGDRSTLRPSSGGMQHDFRRPTVQDDSDAPSQFPAKTNDIIQINRVEIDSTLPILSKPRSVSLGTPYSAKSSRNNLLTMTGADDEGNLQKDGATPATALDTIAHQDVLDAPANSDFDLSDEAAFMSSVGSLADGRRLSECSISSQRSVIRQAPRKSSAPPVIMNPEAHGSQRSPKRQRSHGDFLVDAENISALRDDDARAQHAYGNEESRDYHAIDDDIAPVPLTQRSKSEESKTLQAKIDELHDSTLNHPKPNPTFLPNKPRNLRILVHPTMVQSASSQPNSANSLNPSDGMFVANGDQHIEGRANSDVSMESARYGVKQVDSVLGSFDGLSPITSMRQVDSLLDADSLFHDSTTSYDHILSPENYYHDGIGTAADIAQKFGTHRGNHIKLVDEGRTAVRVESLDDTIPGWNANQTAIGMPIFSPIDDTRKRIAWTFRFDAASPDQTVTPDDFTVFVGLIDPLAGLNTDLEDISRRGFAFYLADGSIHHDDDHRMYAEDDFVMQAGDEVTVILIVDTMRRVMSMEFEHNGVNLGIAWENIGQDFDACFSPAVSFTPGCKVQATFMSTQGGK